MSSNWLQELLGKEPDEEFKRKFWSRVDIKGPEDCWEWQLGKNPKGYGIKSIYTKQENIPKNKVILTHRIAATLTGKPVCSGMLVCHHCDNPSCCNPAHLYVGTNAQNQLDCTLRTRRYTKLTKEAVIYIRHMYTTAFTRQLIKQLAQQFGVDVSLIRLAAKRKTWKHVI